MSKLNTQVLIVGAGPVGMIGALSLARAGINSIIVERHHERRNAPKAHAINARTLEICERLGLSADKIRGTGASIEDGGLVHFVDTLSSTHFGSLPYERQDDGAREFTPWPLVNIAQPVFEGFLHEAVDACDAITVHRGTTASAIYDKEDHVVVSLDPDNADTPGEIHADYVIAADGANSNIRNMLGIGLTGPEGLQHNMMIHFEADLTEITRAHPGLLYFGLKPDARGVFIGYERARNWVFMQGYNPATESRDDFDEDRCKDLVQAAIGSQIDIKICNVSPWSMCAQVADTYSQGRVFLAGDAAHRFPPTGGLGLNTGVADAENLAWKIAKVLEQEASPSLLETYESERKPVAETNSQQSLTNSAKMLHLFSAVYGADPTSAATHYEAVRTDPTAHPAVAEAIEIQRPHFDSFNLQIGYRYGEELAPEELDISRYEPRFESGDFLPRVELVDSPWLLGLLPNDQFCLVTGPDDGCWRRVETPIFAEGTEFQPEDSFYGRAGLQRDGALLIRPDGHICARWNKAPADPKGAVQQALDAALHTNLEK